MKKRISKLLLGLILTSMAVTNAKADGLSNANLNFLTNGATYTQTANGIQFNLNGGTTTIGWDKLNVLSNESLNFLFNVANSTAYNQINSANGISQIAGKINALGSGAASSNIVLFNPAGVTFANGAIVNVGALTVQSLADIKVDNLWVEKGDLKFDAANNVNINGIRYDAAGKLEALTTNGNINVANILNASGIDLNSAKNVLIGAGETTVGGQKINGVTSEYFTVNAKDGKVDITGKITVGKDFNIIAKTTDGININNATVETTNGKFTLNLDTNINGAIKISNSTINATKGLEATSTNNGAIKIAQSSVKSTNGTIKLSSNNILVENNSTIDNLSIDSSRKVEIKDSKITNKFDSTKSSVSITNSTVKDIDVSGGGLTADNTTFDSINAGTRFSDYSDNTPVTLSNSSVKTLNMAGQRLTMSNTKITDTATLENVLAEATGNGNFNTSFINNLNVNGGGITASNYKINNIVGNFGGVHLTNSTAGTVNILGSGSSFVNSKVDTLIAGNTSSLELNNTKFVNPVKLNWVGNTKVIGCNYGTALKIADNSTINGDLTVSNSNITANGLRVVKHTDSEYSSLNLTNGRLNTVTLSGGGGIKASGMIIEELNAGTKYEGYSDNAPVNLTDSTVGNLNMFGQTLFLNNTKITGTLNTTNVPIYATGNGNYSTSFINNLVMGGGGINASDYKINNINATYAGVHLLNSLAGRIQMLSSGASFVNSTVDTFIASDVTLTLDNSKFINPLQLGRINSTTILNSRGEKAVNLPDKLVINGNLTIDNSDVSANTLKVLKDLNAQNSNISFLNSEISGKASLNDVNYLLTNTRFFGDVYFNKSITNNNITSTEISDFVSKMSNPQKTDKTLYLGGSTYSGNVIANGENALDLNNKFLNITTLGNVDLNIRNTKGLSIENSSNTNLTSVLNDEYQPLAVDKVIAQNDIKIDVKSMNLSPNSTLGIIDSKTDKAKIKTVDDVTKSGKLTDTDGRTYRTYQIGTSTYRVYDSKHPEHPEHPKHPDHPAKVSQNVDSSNANYVNTLRVDNRTHNFAPTNDNQLAGQFSRNVRSFAADRVNGNRVVLSELRNGFRIENRIIPSII